MTDAMKAVEAARAALATAEAALNEERRSRLILCRCGEMHAIRDLHLIIKHWYTEPHGCTGGDYWTEGEWRFVCPVTSVENRLLFDDYNVEHEKRQTVGVAAQPTFKNLYRGLFASSEDRYKDDSRGYRDNNFYVDENREYFELPLKGKV